MVEIQIRRPIKLLDNCLCTPGSSNNQNQRRSTAIRGGLTTKNGIDFFPEEFLPDKKKAKKLKGDSLKMLALDRN